MEKKHIKLDQGLAFLLRSLTKTHPKSEALNREGSGLNMIHMLLEHCQATPLTQAVYYAKCMLVLGFAPSKDKEASKRFEHLVGQMEGNRNGLRTVVAQQQELLPPSLSWSLISK